MEDKFKHNAPKGKDNHTANMPGKETPTSPEAVALPGSQKPTLTVSGVQPKPVPGPAPFTAPTGQMPGPEAAPPVDEDKLKHYGKSDKPVKKAVNVKKGEGITYIGQYKKFLAEFEASGQTYHVGMYDTEEAAVEARATAKAHLYP